MNFRTTHKLLITGAALLAAITAATGSTATASTRSDSASDSNAGRPNRAAIAGELEKHHLENALNRLVAAGAPGATILVRQGKRTTLIARGRADTQRKKPLQPSDTFRIGSLTKTYVATLVLHLAQDRRLSLDDPAARYLPGLIPAADTITIRQLLNHSSGLYDVLEDPRVLKPYLAGNLAYHWAPRKLVQLAVSHRQLSCRYISDTASCRPHRGGRSPTRTATTSSTSHPPPTSPRSAPTPGQQERSSPTPRMSRASTAPCSPDTSSGPVLCAR